MFKKKNIYYALLARKKQLHTTLSKLTCTYILHTLCYHTIILYTTLSKVMCTCILPCLNKVKYTNYISCSIQTKIQQKVELACTFVIRLNHMIYFTQPSQEYLPSQEISANNYLKYLFTWNEHQRVQNGPAYAHSHSLFGGKVRTHGDQRIRW